MRPLGRMMASSVAKLTARLSPEAEADFLDILEWSTRHFGVAAAKRYADLIIQALHDLEVDAERPGVQQRPELPTGVHTYHLAQSHDRVAGGRVKAPRHFILYRIEEQRLDVLRILHDSRDLARYLSEN